MSCFTRSGRQTGTVRRHRNRRSPDHGLRTHASRHRDRGTRREVDGMPRPAGEARVVLRRGAHVQRSAQDRGNYPRRSRSAQANRAIPPDARLARCRRRRGRGWHVVRAGAGPMPGSAKQPRGGRQNGYRGGKTRNNDANGGTRNGAVPVLAQRGQPSTGYPSSETKIPRRKGLSSRSSRLCDLASRRRRL